LSIIILKQVIASLFKRKNSAVVPANDLELLASMELRWFDPADARKLVELAVSQNLLEETETGLKTKFEIDSIEIPLGFKPPKDLLTALELSKESLFMQLVNQISLDSGIEPNQIIADINDKQSKFQEYLTLEVIALLYGKEKEVDVDKFIPEIKSKLLSDLPIS
jgi:hypothetical protein